MESIPLQGLGRYWFGGKPFRTHLLNSLHVVLFYGERFMIRAVQEEAERLPAGRLREQIQWFCRQEGQHAAEHRRFWGPIEAQGWRLAGLARICAWVEAVFLPRLLPLPLRLSVSAAIEHNTSVFAHLALRDGLFQSMEPPARRLMEWHCAEEIEHRNVVFEALRARGPRSYVLRLFGMAVAIGLLSGLVFGGALALLAQDRSAWRWATLQDAVRLLWTKEALFPRGLALGWIYLRPGYHPDQLDSLAYATAVLGRPLSELRTS
jgi:hypothetical protein